MSPIVANKIGIFADPHGDYRAMKQMLQSGISNAFLLGDYDLERPMDEEMKPLVDAGCEVYWIHGNHDADRVEWHDYVFDSPMADRNLTNKVVNVGGMRVAGLGGVFHADIWHPKDGDGSPKVVGRSDYLSVNGSKSWRGGLPLRHRSSIFMEDFNALAGMEADVLVSHEAPSSHKYGYKEIDDLAEIMGVKVIVHGHIHQRYDATLPNGIRVIGLGKAEFYQTTIEELLG